MASRMPATHTAKVADAATIARTAWAVMQEPGQPYTGYSVDELLLHPAQAIEVCRLTSLRLSRRLMHHQILRALLNARKHGHLK
jgi:hypothetical protein